MTRRVLFLALISTCVGPASAPIARADDPPPGVKPREVHWPGEGGKKIEVSVGIFLVSFARINLREESFDMAGYLDTSWVDPNLALPPGERRGRLRRYAHGVIWAPALEFVNAVEQVNAERDADLYVADDGRVTQRVRFSHKFQSPFRLERFPFDAQILSVVVAPFDPFAKDLNLVVDPGRVGQLEEASAPDWQIMRVSARDELLPGGDPTDRRFVFEVRIRRQWNYYFYRVLFPMTFLVIATWTVFWFEPNNLQPQISTALAILLSFVTFNYAVDFSLPKVSYLTFIDRYALTSFGFVLAVTFAVSALHVLIREKGLDLALRLQRRARWAFPLAYLLTIIGQAMLAFR
ncbi:hypothetical protein TA3x_001060 [Tundrisphaera sp. TA3]|uniref:hypothetical protein n=1 Tax=Tundrisphaera sp. TA3 TaxID=3435775 RepID=UPI003EC0F3E8